MTAPADNHWSIAGWLGRRLIVALSLCWLAAVLGAALVVRFEMNEVFDSVLMETAQHLLPDIIAAHRDALAEYPRPLTMAVVPHDEYVTYQIMTLDGQVRLRSHGAPDTPYLLPLHPGHSNVAGRRIYTELSPDHRFVIQIAEPPGHRDDAIRGTTLSLVAPLLALVPLAGLLVHWTVRRGLTPVAVLQREIAGRHGSNLVPIAAGALPRELQPIQDHVNQLLVRLAQAIEAERRFTADSAHELRTPIAAAIAQAQLLLQLLPARSPDTIGLHTRVETIAGDMRRLSRRVEKMLQMARVDAGIGLAGTPIDLLDVLHLLRDELGRRPGSMARIAIDPRGQDRFMAAIDVDAAAIALRNLLENALAHGAPDEVVCAFPGPDRTIHVLNAGPIVPAEALASLPARFRRLPTRTDGSGLGLSIVAAIMRQCGGALELHSPATGQACGFEAVLRFPPCAAGAEVSLRGHRVHPDATASQPM